MATYIFDDLKKVFTIIHNFQINVWYILLYYMKHNLFVYCFSLVTIFIVFDFYIFPPINISFFSVGNILDLFFSLKTYRNMILIFNLKKNIYQY